MFNKNKPKIHKVIKTWQANGIDYWLMPYKDFNNLYDKENVVEVNGVVQASLTFADTPIVIQR